MKLGPNTKPHRGEPGYVCEMRCKTGGHIVIYDLDIRLPENREAGAKRWRVQHEPSSVGAGVESLKSARANMKMLAKATSADDAGVLWYILPQFSVSAPAIGELPAHIVIEPKQRAATDTARAAAFKRFMDDDWDQPPSRERMDDLSVAFGLKEPS